MMMYKAGSLIVVTGRPTNHSYMYGQVQRRPSPLRLPNYKLMEKEQQCIRQLKGGTYTSCRSRPLRWSTIHQGAQTQVERTRTPTISCTAKGTTFSKPRR